jgi:hypothetical protein
MFMDMYGDRLKREVPVSDLARFFAFMDALDTSGGGP